MSIETIRDRMLMIMGIIVIISFIGAYVWKELNKYDPPKPITLEEYLIHKTEMDKAEELKDKARHDSLMNFNRGMAGLLKLKQAQIDSNLYNFYHYKTDTFYEKQINAIRRADDPQLYDFFSKRYGR